MIQRIIIPIAPRSWVQFRSGKDGDQKYWFIPLDCRSRHRITGNEEDKGKPCDDYLAGNEFCGHTDEETGKFISHTLSKKGRQNKANIEKYNKYRVDLYHLSKKLDFYLPSCGMAVYYYYPVPVRWPKKKKAEMHGQMKMSKPDITNLDKAFEDALTDYDEQIGQTCGSGKFWFQPELVAEELRQGYIEILLGCEPYNPFGVKFIDQHRLISMEDLEVRREKRKARKEEMKAQKKEQEKAAKVPKSVKVIPEKKLFKRKTDELK